MQSESGENRLHKVAVDTAVRTSVEIRGHDGSAPRIAPIAGILAYAVSPRPSVGTAVHNLGLGRGTLEIFCSSHAGDRFALLDDVKPGLVTVLFSNDCIYDDPDGFERRLRMLVERVEGYADVVLINPCEQRPSERVVYEGNFRIGRRDTVMQARYRAATRRVAEERRCALIDLYDAWAAVAGSGWEAASAFGLMNDDLHPSQAGHDDIFARVRSLLGC
jgi:lysophospholipase L1-like esterase